MKSGEVLPHASGLFWHRYNGRTTISHNGAAAGFNADVLYFPGQRLSVVCLCNRGDVDATTITRRIAGVYLGRPAPMKPLAPSRPVAADLAGTWESRKGFILSTSIQGDHLVASTGGTTFQLFGNAKSGAFRTKSDGARRYLQRRGRDSVEVWWEGDRKQTFQRLPEISNTEKSVFAGRFLNHDLNLDWKLIVADGALTITTNAGWRIPLTQVAPDRFAVGPWVLRFRRENGTVAGFDLHRERLWNLRFGLYALQHGIQE